MKGGVGASGLGQQAVGALADYGPGLLGKTRGRAICSGHLVPKRRNVLQSLPKGTVHFMRRLLVAITLVLAVMFSAPAQTTAAPDFSGTWVLNVANSTLPKDSTLKSQTIIIDNKK